MNYLASSSQQRLNIAVIGTGIAGMSAAWLLNQGHRVTVYEKNDRTGGHSNTVYAPTKHDMTAVDTGFIVYNEQSYPNLTALFNHLNVKTKPSEMSFGASLNGGRLEYSGTDLNGLLGQRLNLMRPRFWSMMIDLLRFYREASNILENPSVGEMTLGEFLRANGYGKNFIKDHILPMGAAIWSTTASDMADYPVEAFIRFFQSHGLLKLKNRPEWRTVDGGSREYVKALTAGYQKKIHFEGVQSVTRLADEVLVKDLSGNIKFFDNIVIATHADEAFRILEDPDNQEEQLLGGWRYTQNRALLHSDETLMPRRKRVWSSWNFIGDSSGTEEQKLCVTYWMNRLQSLDPDTPLFVTLNPVREPDPNKIIQEFNYSHPYFDKSALATQKKLWPLQGHRRTWYCGSYFGYGFHEDALQAGLAVAEQLGGVRRPWTVEEENGRIHVRAKAESAGEGVAA